MPAVSEQARKGTAPAPPAGRPQSGEEEEDAEGSPSSLGITKAENYKTKYKGENQRASEPSALRRRTLALPAPCRGVRFASSLPAPDRPWGDPGGGCPPRSALPCSCIGGLPRLLLTPCSKCWLGSGGASPGQCRRGARSPRSPSRSAGSSCSL